MIVTNNLTEITFDEIGPAPPSTYDLSSYVPEGALLASHIEYRYRTADTFYGQYVPVAGWNDTTRIATVSLPPGAVTVQFRRNTPRYSLVENPLDGDTRFTASHLRINADQGMMVALEWAAQYGVDGHAALLSGSYPITAELYTQCHWGTSTDYTRKVWNFQFAGGYIDRTHVRVQALIDGVWTAIPLDYTAWDDPTPNGAQYRFIGPYQLRLDFGALASRITHLIIYRHTPRDSKVARPADGEEADAGAMEPSARHALFVAVELGEELSHNVPSCECRRIFTSQPYSVLLTESLGVAATASAGAFLDSPSTTDRASLSASLVLGELRDIVQPYNNWIAERIGLGSSLQAGALVTVVAPYNNWIAERVSLSTSLISGSMPVVVVSYNNWPAESVSLGSSLVSGTLA